ISRWPTSASTSSDTATVFVRSNVFHAHCCSRVLSRYSMGMRQLAWLLVALAPMAIAGAAACRSGDVASGESGASSGQGGSGAASGAGGGGGGQGVSPGLAVWKEQVGPSSAAACARCHVGPRFAFASLERAGAEPTPEETKRNYQRFFDLLSLDAPDH